MKTTTIMKTALVGALLASVAAVAPASAGDFKFAYRAHEMQSEAGREYVLSRLERRARSYCRAYLTPSLRWKVKDCAGEVVDDIVDQIDDRRLSALRRDELGAIASR
jgi:UrcA family protein